MVQLYNSVSTLYKENSSIKKKIRQVMKMQIKIKDILHKKKKKGKTPKNNFVGVKKLLDMKTPTRWRNHSTGHKKGYKVM
jgi:SMC interacting uncharacterized protein involved in chromosome segregation